MKKSGKPPRGGGLGGPSSKAGKAPPFSESWSVIISMARLSWRMLRNQVRRKISTSTAAVEQPQIQISFRRRL